MLDAGCGIGADVALLASALPGARITALDASPVFIAEVARRYPDVRAVAGDMRVPPPGPYDLIWSAGAVYHLGVGEALAAWRDALAPGGRVAFSDLCKRVEDLPEECAAFWASEGLVLRDAEALQTEVEAAGWRVLGADWVSTRGWAAYYEPLEAALASFDNPGLVAAFTAEIACWRQWGETFGYRLIVCEPVGICP